MWIDPVVTWIGANCLARPQNWADELQSTAAISKGSVKKIQLAQRTVEIKRKEDKVHRILKKKEKVS